MVASSGGWNCRVSGSRRIPSEARTDGGASAIHSPIAVNDRDPASTAAIAAASSEHSEWRIPRGSRGSGTRARYSSRLRLPGRQQFTLARRKAGELVQGRTDQG